MTTTVATDKKKIEKRIIEFSGKSTLSNEHKDLVDRVTKRCRELGYNIKPMGFATKNTTIPFSDVDLLAIMPEKKAHFNPSTSLVHLQQLLTSPFNPQPGNHSIIIRENGMGVDVVPAKKTKILDKYSIPSRRGNYWLQRGQDEFTKEFNKLNNITGEKLSSAVKIMKLWNYQKTTFDLSSLSLEKIAYDALKGDNCPNNNVDAVLRCFDELKEQISKNILHPGKGIQLNKLSLKQREQWKTVIERDLKTLKTFKLSNWIKIFGNQF